MRPLYRFHSSGPLILGIPLAELVAEGEHALLRPGALLVAPRAAESRVEAVLGDRVEQRDRLQPVARGPRPGLLDHPAAVDRLLHARDLQALAELGHAPVAELDHLGEVVPRVDVHQRKGERSRTKRLLREPQQDDRVLAAAEQQHRPLEFGGDLAHHVDRLGLERPQVAELGPGRDAHPTTGLMTCRPHSVFSVPAQRPSRPLPGCVHGAQPMDS